MNAIYKGDKWTRLMGSEIPLGAAVVIARFMSRRRVIVEYAGRQFLTMLWCVKYDRLRKGGSAV